MKSLSISVPRFGKMSSENKVGIVSSEPQFFSIVVVKYAAVITKLFLGLTEGGSSRCEGFVVGKLRWLPC